MGNVALLALMMAAFGVTSGRSTFRKCFMCSYNFDMTDWPYEQLRDLGEEILSYLSEDEQMALGEVDLNKPEPIFKEYCEKICTKNHLLAPTETEVADSDSSVAKRAFIQRYNGSAMLPGSIYRISWPGVKLRTMHNGLIIDPFAKESTVEEGDSKSRSENIFEGSDKDAFVIIAAPEETSSSAEAETKILNDKYKDRSEILLTSGVRYLNAGRVSADEEGSTKGGAALAD